MPGDGYRRREPEKTVLYRALHRHLPLFLYRAETSGRELPGFVRNELKAFLKCGILTHGFARFECKSCRHNHVVALSCKARGFCPSCGGRRMTERAAHLVDEVFPNVPVRQWVLSLPIEVRYLMAFNAGLCSEILNAFNREVFRWYRHRGKEYANLKSMAEARCGSVTFIQRAGSALNLNVHFHMLAIDGIYIHKDWKTPLRFLALPAPSDADVEDVLRRVRKRVMKILTTHSHDDTFDEFRDQEPLLAACVAGALTGPARKLGTSEPMHQEVVSKSARCASVDYYSLHANTRIRAGERKRLEKLCRYVARPPISNELLVELVGGSIGYKLKRSWQDGTTAVVFSPQEFIQRLASMVPPPRCHQVRYHGVLASASSLREFVVPASPPKNSKRPAKNYCWAELMKRAFEIDVLECPHCAGPMRFIACIMERDVIKAILGSMGMPADSPAPLSSLPIPQLDFQFEENPDWEAA